MAAEEFTFAQELQLDRIYEKMFDVCKTICDEFDSADDGDNAFVMRMADLLAEDILHETNHNNIYYPHREFNEILNDYSIEDMMDNND